MLPLPLLFLYTVSTSTADDVFTVQMDNIHPRVTEIQIYDLMMTVASNPPISIRLVPFSEVRSDRKGFHYALISFRDKSDVDRVSTLHDSVMLEGMRVHLTLDDARNIRKDESLKGHTNTVMFTNLNRNVTEIQLLFHMSTISEISTKPRITLKHHPIREDYPSSAYVQFASINDATLCIDALNLSTLEGQRMWVRGCRIRSQSKKGNSKSIDKKFQINKSKSSPFRNIPRWQGMKGKSCTVSLVNFHDLVSHRGLLRISKSKEIEFIPYPKDTTNVELREYRIQRVIPDEVRTYIEWLYFGGNTTLDGNVHCIRNVEVVVDVEGEFVHRVNLEMISPEAASTVFDLVNDRVYNGHQITTSFSMGPCHDFTIRMCPVDSSLRKHQIRSWIKDVVKPEEIEYLIIEEANQIRDEKGNDITKTIRKMERNRIREEMEKKKNDKRPKFMKENDLKYTLKGFSREAVIAFTTEQALFKGYEALCKHREEMQVQVDMDTLQQIGIEEGGDDDDLDQFDDYDDDDDDDQDDDDGGGDELDLDELDDDGDALDDDEEEEEEEEGDESLYCWIEIQQTPNQKELNYSKFEYKSKWLRINNIPPGKGWKGELKEWIAKTMKKYKEWMIRQIYVQHHPDNSGHPGYAVIHCDKPPAAGWLMEELNGQRFEGNVVDIEYLEQKLYDRHNHLTKEGVMNENTFIVMHWPMKVSYDFKERQWTEEWMQKLMAPKDQAFPKPIKFELMAYDVFPMGAAKICYKDKAAASRVFHALDGRRVLNRTLRTTVRGIQDKELRRGFSLRKRLLRKEANDSKEVENVNGSLCGRNKVKTLQLNLKQLTKLRKMRGGRYKRQLMHKALHINIKKKKMMILRPQKRKRARKPRDPNDKRPWHIKRKEKKEGKDKIGVKNVKTLS